MTGAVAKCEMAFSAAREKLTALTDAFSSDENGATAIEYSLIVSLIFLAVITAINAYTDSTGDMYDEIESTLTDATN